MTVLGGTATAPRCGSLMPVLGHMVRTLLLDDRGNEAITRKGMRVDVSASLDVVR